MTHVKINKVTAAQDDESVGELTERRTSCGEPGRTAGPSAALGMTKGRAVTSIRGRQIGWTEKKQQVPFDFAQGRLSSFRFGPTARRGDDPVGV
jgi:hypothetical protein